MLHAPCNTHSGPQVGLGRRLVGNTSYQPLNQHIAGLAYGQRALGAPDASVGARFARGRQPHRIRGAYAEVPPCGLPALTEVLCV